MKCEAWGPHAVWNRLSQLFPFHTRSASFPLPRGPEADEIKINRSRTEKQQGLQTPCGHDPLSSFHANMPSRRQAQLRLLTTTGMFPIHVLKFESLRRRVGSTEYFGASVFVPSNKEIVEEKPEQPKSTLRASLEAQKTRLLVSIQTRIPKIPTQISSSFWGLNNQ
ncbi:hypothetical protein FJTKL_03389 [Diaporthe vaccinii]|uniref:Uncharacterized protein n=1 Tax=Diaporthe vaccinii TaxID=105482 RepID=A0ABR4F2E0_9PEZI